MAFHLALCRGDTNELEVDGEATFPFLLHFSYQRETFSWQYFSKNDHLKFNRFQTIYK